MSARPLAIAASALILAWTASPSLATFVQHGAKLIGTGAVAPAYQGYSVALSSDGNTAIVGAPLDNASSGAAWVYTRSAGVWSQQGAKLVGAGAVGLALQGYSVAISGDGNTAIVGGWTDDTRAGAVWVYTRIGGGWSQQGSKLVGTGAVGEARQGNSVALSGDGNTAIVGGSFDNGEAGAAWVYTRSNGVWSQQGPKLAGTGHFGYSVALSADGNTTIIGAPAANAAWVYTRATGVWSQQGSPLVGTGFVGGARQGFSVALSTDGNTAIVGGNEDGSDGLPHSSTPYGAAWVFTRSAGVWSQQGAKLVGTGMLGYAQQGQSVALSDDGNTAMVGGYADYPDGAAWTYKRSAGAWSQWGDKLVGSGGAGPTRQGFSVALSGDGNTALSGGFSDNAFAGATWVFVEASPVNVEEPELAPGLAFSLEGARPNPTRGDRLSVSFALPSSAAARLELLDMSGRRVLTRDVGSLGAGRHTLKLSEDRRLAPGLYWVRLTQGEHSRAARVVVIE